LIDDAMTATTASPGDLVEVQAHARVLVARGEALEHALLVLADDQAAVGLRDRQTGRGLARQDGFQDLLQRQHLPLVVQGRLPAGTSGRAAGCG